MIKISFSHSRSKLFGEAVKMAKRLPGYSLAGSVHSIECRSVDLFENWQAFSSLYALSGKWTSFKVFVDGKQLTPNAGVFFYAMQEIGYCQKQVKYHECRQDVNRPGWGCAKLNRIKRHIDHYSYLYWYQFGKFALDFRSWVIDKEMLRDRLMTDAVGMFLGECPQFDPERITQAIASLPNSIDLGNTKFWEVVYRQDFVGDRIGKIPDGIRHVIPETDLPIEWPDPEPEKKEVDKMSDEEINRLIDENVRFNLGNRKNKG